MLAAAPLCWYRLHSNLKRVFSPPPPLAQLFKYIAMLSYSPHILIARERQCNSVSEECPVTNSFYGYAPSYPPNAILLALFGLALIIHTAQGIYFRTWGILVAFSLGCLCEVIGTIRSTTYVLRYMRPHITPGHGLTWHLLSNAGYGGRIMMHANAYELNGFLLQICCISLAPAFFSAAIYFCLSRMYVLRPSTILLAFGGVFPQG